MGNELSIVVFAKHGCMSDASVVWNKKDWFAQQVLLELAFIVLYRLPEENLGTVQPVKAVSRNDSEERKHFAWVHGIAPRTARLHTISLPY